MFILDCKSPDYYKTVLQLQLSSPYFMQSPYIPKLIFRFVLTIKQLIVISCPLLFFNDKSRDSKHQTKSYNKILQVKIMECTTPVS